jgi:hypothetical protein
VLVPTWSRSELGTCVLEPRLHEEVRSGINWQQVSKFLPLFLPWPRPDEGAAVMLLFAGTGRCPTYLVLLP